MKSLVPSMDFLTVAGLTRIYLINGLTSIFYDMHQLPGHLLLMDGHSSHYHPGTIRKAAAKNKVVLFVLPPNTTHLTQPLDKGCFGPLKSKWSEVCHKYMAKNPGKVVNRYVFSQLLHEAWTDAMTSLNIKQALELQAYISLIEMLLQ